MASFFSSIALKILVAIIAVVGGILKYKPHLVFSIPNGFILHAISGGNIPPYFSHGNYDVGKNDWLKQNDVVVSTAAKSGTTWMLFCSHQVRVKGNDEKYPFVDVSITTPWPDLIEVPGEEIRWEDRLEKYNTHILPDGTALKDHWDHPDYDFRIFKSHETPDNFGDLIGSGNTKVKFLAMARNGLDQVASFVPFWDNHSDEFRKMWGGFPPADGGAEGGEKERKVASQRLEEMLPGNMFGFWHWEYINKWWKVKDEKNVLLLHYSDAKKDLPGIVKQLADFYEVPLSKKEHDSVVEKCGFDYMKKNTHLFNYKLPLHPNSDIRMMNNGTMTRKGVNGQGKVVFSDEEKAKWAKAEEEQFGDDPEKLNWARHGAL